MSDPPTFAPDLTNCDREPIHVPGAIQPHGVLIAALERSGTIEIVSANLFDVLGVEMQDAVGREVIALVDPASRPVLTSVLTLSHFEDACPLSLSVRGKRFDASLHRQKGALILELEPALDLPNADPTDGSLRHALAKISSAPALPQLLRSTVERIQALTSFERVMVYQFDEEGHGEVIAEMKEPSLEAYLGFHYPASDIPRQARELYLKNWIRIIPDARYTPARLVPPVRSDTGEPLDLTFSVLRSVSPIHLEYLANMGLRASMSISIVARDRLWGLISCGNHSGPLYLSPSVRSACELIGRLVSMQISAFEDREVAARRPTRAPLLAMLKQAMRADDDVLEGMITRPAEVLALTRSTGLAVVDGESIRIIGNAPPPTIVEAIGAWANAAQEASDVIATHSVATHVPAAVDAKDVASGVMTFALPGEPPRRILWFRPEVLQTVNWGGNPSKPVEENTGRIHPRRSFALWQEEVRLRSEPWSAADRDAAAELRRLVLELDLEVQVKREQRAVRLREDLVAVVSHDLKSPLQVIDMQTSLLSQLAKGADPARAEQIHAGLDRIHRSAARMNGLIHGLLDLAQIEAGRFQLRCRPEPVKEMIEEAIILLRPLAEAKNIGLVEDLRSSTEVNADRERIFQVVSNLVGNAIKFTPERGRIRLSIEERDQQVVIAVTDTGPGVPPESVAHLFNRYWQAPGRRKGGSGLGLYIAKGIVEAHGGHIWVERPPEGGASFRFSLPLQRVQPSPVVRPPGM